MMMHDTQAGHPDSSWHMALQVSVRDLVSQEALGAFGGELTLPVPCHGVRVLRLTPLR